MPPHGRRRYLDLGCAQELDEDGREAAIPRGFHARDRGTRHCAARPKEGLEDGRHVGIRDRSCAAGKAGE